MLCNTGEAQEGSRHGNKSLIVVPMDAKGIDRRVAGPFFLDAQAPGVRVGINPGTPAIPPDQGMSDCFPQL